MNARSPHAPLSLSRRNRRLGPVAVARVGAMPLHAANDERNEAALSVALAPRT